MSTDDLKKKERVGLEAKLEKLRNNAVNNYRPYQKQRDFHLDGARYRERLLMAGNQLGKTLAAGAEVSMHLTGVYPDWWMGREFTKPPSFWVAGVTGEGTRDGAQRMLMGRVNAIGTGMIPRDKIKDYRKKTGVADAIDYVIVKHVSGGEAYLGFKSYDQGREKFQAETLDGVWFDEEPPADIYTEGLTRTNATRGIVFVTFTPLLGMSEVVKRFLLEQNPQRHVVHMTIDDVGHYSDEEKAAIIASYPIHERDARARGIPILGSGRVFPVSEEQISVQPFDIPRSWPLICGIDFGWDHPSAAAKLAWDRDADCIYVTACARQREASPVIFSAQVKHWGDWVPWAWPHDGLQHNKVGQTFARMYKDNGLNMLPERVTFEDGTNSVEAGVLEILERMQTGRFKVFSHLNDWFEEFRLYHRKDGKIVKEGDDIMSATRYAVMGKRFAKVKHIGFANREVFVGDSRVGY